MNNMEFQKNDKVLCRIINYIPKERSFEVEDVITHTKGWVIFVHHYEDIPPMKEAFNSHKTVPLYFDKYEDGTPLFTYRLYNEAPKKETENSVAEKINSALTVNMSFSVSNSEFNTQLFNALFNSLGEIIDTDEKYKIAKQLLSVNRVLKISQGLTKDLFKKSNNFYQTKFWSEGLLPFCSNIGIRKSWNSADEEGKQIILQRLGISLTPASENKLVCFFDGIEEEVLRNIQSAKTTIYACMAWFTNFNIFKAIRCKLDEGVTVVLLTNNDLINNGGYCLNFNELIEKGLSLHLAEYPELIHHKFCIIDGKLLMTGSYNWTFFSENINRENMIVVKDDQDTIRAYMDEFNMLIEQYEAVDRMPESVPEKPEYDRSSFKQYISEELVLRSKNRIGNIKENILNAKRLSPMYTSVLQAITDFNIVEDNSSLTVEQIEHSANTAAIAERREQIITLNQRQQNLVAQRVDLEQERIQIVQQQEEVAAQAQQITENEDVTEEERREMQENIRIQAQQLEHRHEQIESSIIQVEQESTAIEKAVNQTEVQIATIQSTSQIVTEGGRGTLKVNLKWNTYDDLDLHVIDPDGFEINFSAKEHRCQDVLGKLDVDANAGMSHTRTPQENIFWEDGKNAPLGRYKVFVEYYSKKDTFTEVPFTVTIYPDKGQSKVFTGIMYNAKDKRDIVDFDYTENGISYVE